MTPEGRIKKIVKEWLNSKKFPHWSIIPSAYGSTTGMSDIVSILPDGKWLAIEIKAEGKRNNTTPNQKKFLKSISDNNGLAIVISCEEDLRELEAML